MNGNPVNLLNDIIKSISSSQTTDKTTVTLTRNDDNTTISTEFDNNKGPKGDKGDKGADGVVDYDARRDALFDYQNLEMDVSDKIRVSYYRTDLSNHSNGWGVDMSTTNKKEIYS
mgnify:CR=1 FL=1